MWYELLQTFTLLILTFIAWALELWPNFCCSRWNMTNHLPQTTLLWCAQEIESETMKKWIFRKYRSVQGISRKKLTMISINSGDGKPGIDSSSWSCYCSIFLPNLITEEIWKWILGSSQECLMILLENLQPCIQIQDHGGGQREGNLVCLCQDEVQDGKSHHTCLPSLPLGLCHLAPRTRISWKKLWC